MTMPIPIWYTHTKPIILCPYFIYLHKDNSHQNHVVKIGLRGHMNTIPCPGNISVRSPRCVVSTYLLLLHIDYLVAGSSLPKNEQDAILLFWHIFSLSLSLPPSCKAIIQFRLRYHQKSQLRTSQKEIWRFFLSLSILRINVGLSSPLNESFNPTSQPQFFNKTLDDR